MRVAVPFDHGKIYGHFGRTAQFKLYDLTDGRPLWTRWETATARWQDF